jgi:hypothetical protein
MKFKELEIEPESNWFKRFLASKSLLKSIIYIGIGAIAGFIYFYLTEGKNMDEMASIDIVKSMLFGGFLVFFITNSPCARGRC